MSKQHYIPASYIGRFSSNTKGPLRKRSVWVQRVGQAPYRTSAERVGSARGIYDRRRSIGNEPTTVDGSWKYEGDLPAALTKLSNPNTPLDGRTWAQVLVPFVSSLFIRGLDFKDRYEKRIPGITGPGPGQGLTFEPSGSWHDNTISSGQIEWQRLLAPTMAAQWIVLHGSGKPILPTNDVGYCLISQPDGSDRMAYAIPINPATILILDPNRVRRLLEWDGQKWIARIEHRQISDTDLLNGRKALQHGAFKEVYGPTKESVEFSTPDFYPAIGPLGSGFLMESLRSSRALIPYLEDYFRVLTILSQDPATFMDFATIDPLVVAKSWTGIVQIIVDAPRFPGGLAIYGNSLYLDLTRFSINDVEKSRLGSHELPAVPHEPSPALRALIETEGSRT